MGKKTFFAELDDAAKEEGQQRRAKDSYDFIPLEENW